MRGRLPSDDGNGQKEEAAAGDLDDRSRSTREPDSTRLLASFLSTTRSGTFLRCDCVHDSCRRHLLHVGIISSCRATCLTLLLQVSTAVFVSPCGSSHDKQSPIGTTRAACVSTLSVSDNRPSLTQWFAVVMAVAGAVYVSTASLCSNGKCRGAFVLRDDCYANALP